MEDIFQLLIWLFIIISFFASFFKKKEVPKKPVPQQRYDQYEEEEQFPVKEQSGSSIDKEEYDILREIESMFKTDTSQPTRMEQKEQRQNETSRTESEHVSYEQTRSADEYTSYERQKPLDIQKMDTARTKTEQVLTSSEHTFDSGYARQMERAKQKIQQVDSTVSKQAEAFEKYLKRKEAVNNTAVMIRERMKQPATLKEYIIFSEIIGKPKALKR